MEHGRTDAPKPNTSEEGSLPVFDDRCAACPGCDPSQEENELEASEANEPPPYQGWQMARVSILVFFLPLATAMTGAIIAGDSATGQAIGALIGGVVGFLVSFLVVRRTSRSASSDESESGSSDGTCSTAE